MPIEHLRMQKQALWYSIVVVLTVEGQISSVPRNETSYLNRQVQFTCAVEAPWILTWEVDGTAARYLSSRNITFNTITTRDAETSTLYIKASLANNNSEIACVSISDNGLEIARAMAFLYIQGVLDAPGNISIVSKSYSSIHLEWSAPFSLQVTTGGISNNVTHFVVSVMNKFDGKMFNETTNQRGYVYQRQDFVHCSGAVFKIAAVNPVGRGAFSEGIETGFDGPSIGVNPLNQTVDAGRWAHFSCQILCSQNEFVTWFINDLPLPSLERSIGAKFRKHPGGDHSHCNNFSIPNETLHVLSIQLDGSFESPMRVYCTVVSLCDLKAVNCTPTMCFSDTAYLEGIFENHSQPTSRQPSVTSVGEMIFSTFERNTFNGTQNTTNNNYSYQEIITAIALVVPVTLFGAFLMIIICILIIILAADSEAKEVNHIYETPSEVEMNQCPAYQTLRPCK